MIRLLSRCLTASSVLLLAGCAVGHSRELAAALLPASSNSASTAGRALGDLPVKGRAPKTGYSRDEFGQAWTDDVSVDGGHNGCGLMDDILCRSMIEMVVKSGRSTIVGVAPDRWWDHYRGVSGPAIAIFKRQPIEHLAV